MYDMGSTTKVKLSIIGLSSNRSPSKTSIDIPHLFLKIIILGQK